MSRRPLALLSLAALSAAAAVAVCFVALGVPRGRALDAGAMEAFVGVARPPLAPSINGIAHLADPAPLLLGGLAARRHRALAPPAADGAAVPVIMRRQRDDAVPQARARRRAPHRAGATSRRSIRLLAQRPCHRGDVARAVCRARRRPAAARRPRRCSAPATRSPSATRWSFSAGTCPATSSAATSWPRRSRCWAQPRCRARGAPAPAARRPRARASPVSVRSFGIGAAAARFVGAVAVAARAPGMTLSALEHPSGILAGVGIAALGLALTAGLAVALRLPRADVRRRLRRRRRAPRLARVIAGLLRRRTARAARRGAAFGFGFAFGFGRSAGSSAAAAVVRFAGARRVAGCFGAADAASATGSACVTEARRRGAGFAARGRPRRPRLRTGLGLLDRSTAGAARASPRRAPHRPRTPHRARRLAGARRRGGDFAAAGAARRPPRRARPA